MLKKLLVAALALVFLAPSLVLIGIVVVMNPALSATGSCTIPAISNVTVGDVPDELEVTAANGETFTLNRTQLTH
ncbi:M23 family peptidase, partial [Burkholderia multivorans]